MVQSWSAQPVEEAEGAGLVQPGGEMALWGWMMADFPYRHGFCQAGGS